jgi:hypothetical protein
MEKLTELDDDAKELQESDFAFEEEASESSDQEQLGLLGSDDPKILQPKLQ